MYHIYEPVYTHNTMYLSDILALHLLRICQKALVLAPGLVAGHDYSRRRRVKLHQRNRRYALLSTYFCQPSKKSSFQGAESKTFGIRSDETEVVRIICCCHNAEKFLCQSKRERVMHV